MDTLKDAIYKELKFGLAATGGDLDGLVLQDNIKQDKRAEIDQDREAASYPYIIFYRVTSTEQTDIKWRRSRFVIELIGLEGIDGSDDDALEAIHDIILSHFSFRKKRIGGYTDAGVVDATKGLVVKPFYVDTADGSFEGMQEKRQLMQFAFSYVRA